MTEREHAAAVAQGQSAHQSRRHLSDRAVGALRGPHRSRSLPDLSRPAPLESVAVHVLLRARQAARRRLLARGARAARPAARQASGRSRARGRAGTTPEHDVALEHELLADPKENAEHVMLVDLARNDLGRVASSGSVHVEPVSQDRALQPRHAHRERRARARRRRSATRSICSPRRSRPARSSARRRCARCSSSPSSSRRRAASTAARSATSPRTATWTRPSRSARWCSTATSTASRPARGIVVRQRAGHGVPGSAREERDPAPGARARRGGTMSVRLLLIDNYDSFTYNLVQAFLVLEAEVLVYRNDALSVADAAKLKPTHLVISPGPGRPDDAGSSLAMIGAFAGKIPVLGVCLGHQSIVQHFGGEIIGAAALMHGKTSLVQHDGAHALSRPRRIRSRSAATTRSRRTARRCRADLIVTARTTDGEIMGVRHRQLERRRRAVPPRERADARRAAAAREFPLSMSVHAAATARAPARAAKTSTSRRRASCCASMASGELAPALAGALLVALRIKGETADEIRGFARAHARARAPARDRAGPVRRHRRHGRRRLEQLEPLDGRVAARGRLRPARRQARQPLRLEQVRQRRRARGARPAAAARRGGRRRVPHALRLHVSVRAALPPRDEAHRARAPGARRAHRVQHLGAARESRRRRRST